MTDTDPSRPSVTVQPGGTYINAPRATFTLGSEHTQPLDVATLADLLYRAGVPLPKGRDATWYTEIAERITALRRPSHDCQLLRRHYERGHR